MVDANQIASAHAQLAEHAYMALIWADETLCVAARHGSLAPEIEVGSDLCDCALALHGMRGEIEALREATEPVLVVPNVAVVGTIPDEPSTRLSYVVMWNGAERQYLVTVLRAITTNDISIELQRQVRRRLLTEIEVAEHARAIDAANEALSRANRDLSDFARIVSHDLKSPMRALRYLADDLERSLTDPVEDDDPRTHLELLRAQSRRMSSMLTGLLAYARLEQKELAIEPVETSALVRAIVASLPRPEGFEVRIEGDWPCIDTCEAPLDLVLRNLIDNAIRHHDRSAGRVVVRCAPAAEFLRISVTDDGPGISERYRGAVFLPYTRLADKKDGSEGMGLALVKRAVDGVSARISIAEPHRQTRGAEFVLDWPRRIVAEK
jgi:signal transduction histidine kinase